MALLTARIGGKPDNSGASPPPAADESIYGGIKGGFFDYITWKMLLCLGIPSAGLLYKHELVAHYFTGGEVVLNGFIITVFLTALSVTTWLNFTIWRNAKFLRELARFNGAPASAETVKGLIARLHKEGELFDISNMENCVKNLERFGHLNFTDMDARLIKSKLGQRINESRKKTTFLAGLLVLMGLIGTYIGLLHTIDKVAGVMKLMSNLEDSSSMLGFVGALSEPLQGMGVAFSASLFGIGGSTATSIYGLFTKGAQNEFVEKTSRWIDDRIPRFAAAADGSKSKALGKAASAEDLRTWLAGFVNLSVKTNNRLNQLAALLMKQGVGGNAQLENKLGEVADGLRASQRSVQGFMEAVTGSVTALADQQQKTIEHIGKNEQGLALLHRDLESLRAGASELTASVPMIVHLLSENRKAQEAIPSARESEVDALKKEMREQTEVIRSLNLSLQALKTLPGAIERLDNTQAQLADGLSRLQSGGGGGDAAFENMFKDMGSELSEESEGLLGKLLEPEEDAGDLEKSESEIAEQKDVFKNL